MSIIGDLNSEVSYLMFIPFLNFLIGQHVAVTQRAQASPSSVLAFPDCSDEAKIISSDMNVHRLFHHPGY